MASGQTPWLAANKVELIVFWQACCTSRDSAHFRKKGSIELSNCLYRGDVVMLRPEPLPAFRKNADGSRGRPKKTRAVGVNHRHTMSQWKQWGDACGCKNVKITLRAEAWKKLWLVWRGGQFYYIKSLFFFSKLMSLNLNHNPFMAAGYRCALV